MKHSIVAAAALIASTMHYVHDGSDFLCAGWMVVFIVYLVSAFMVRK